MPVFQCLGCTYAPCLYLTLGEEIESDDLVCIRRTMNYLPVWREMGAVE